MNSMPELERSFERLPREGMHDPSFNLLVAEHVNRYRFCEQIVIGKYVLDAACGIGYGSKMLAEAGAAQVDGIDISAEAIATAKRHYAHSNIQFAVCDILALSSNEKYDVIVSFETIEHLSDLNKYLKVMHQALKPAGRFFVSTPNRAVSNPHGTCFDKPQNPFHELELMRAELIDLLSGYFHIENIFGQRPYYYSGTRIRTVESIFISKRLRDFLHLPEANYRKFTEIRKHRWYHEPFLYVVECTKK